MPRTDIVDALGYLDRALRECGFGDDDVAETTGFFRTDAACHRPICVGSRESQTRSSLGTRPK